MEGPIEDNTWRYDDLRQLPLKRSKIAIASYLDSNSEHVWRYSFQSSSWELNYETKQSMLHPKRRQIDAK